MGRELLAALCVVLLKGAKGKELTLWCVYTDPRKIEVYVPL